MFSSLQIFAQNQEVRHQLIKIGTSGKVKQLNHETRVNKVEKLSCEKVREYLKKSQDMKQFIIVFALCLGSALSQEEPAAPCAGIAEGPAPNAENCQAYYWCRNNEIAASHECPAGQLYDRIAKVCNYDYLVTNCLAPPNPPITCPADGVLKIAIPGDCVNYVVCVDGEKFNRACQEGTLFDVNTLICELAKNAVCNDCPLVDTPGVLEWRPNRQDCTKYFLCKNREQLPYT